MKHEIPFLLYNLAVGTKYALEKTIADVTHASRCLNIQKGSGFKVIGSSE